MRIGIIGSSISGLVAGEKLAKAGHDVTLFEQDARIGSRFATKKTEHGFFDYGVPHLFPHNNELKNFIDDLEAKNELQPWARHFKYYDGMELHDSHPNRDQYTGHYYKSKNGIQTVSSHLKRWIQVEAPVKVGGLTHIGLNPNKKHSWMINLTNINVFGCDAVIIATDAVNATAILQLVQNKTAVRRLSRFTDEISYKPRYALMAYADVEPPEWKGITCDNADLKWIGNETSKSDQQQETLFTIQSSGDFAISLAQADRQTVIDTLIGKASSITGIDLKPEQTDLHYWRFYEPRKTMDDYFMELEMDEAPLALVGNYFNEWSAGAAYRSGIYLADYWINKFKQKEIVA